MHERIRDHLLGIWGRAVATHPRLTLGICLALAAACAAYAMTGIELKAERSDLVSPELSWNKRYAAYKEQFPLWDQVVICLKGEPGDRRLDQLTKSLTHELTQRNGIFETVIGGFEGGDISPRFIRAAPRHQFDSALEDMAIAQKFARSEHVNAALAQLLGHFTSQASGMNPEAIPPGELQRLGEMLDPFLSALRSDRADFSVFTSRANDWVPITSRSGWLRFVFVDFAQADAGVNSLKDSLPELRRSVTAIIEDQIDVGALDHVPDWGITGIPAIEADETQQSMRDSAIASVIALVLIVVLMVVVFRGISVPFLAALSLLIGVAWSFGWVELAIGHLQVLSVVFAVILLGLGIDYALHLMSRLELVRREHADLPSAVSRVFRGIGPGMLTGAITTAAAFSTTALTDFRGMAEMGIIAAGGILLCVIAVLSAFPACLALMERYRGVIRHREGGEQAHFAKGRLDWADGHASTTVTMSLMVVVLLGLCGLVIPATRVEYDPNITNLQAPGVESVEWQQRIADDDAQKTWAAIVLVDPPEAEAVTERLRDPNVTSSDGEPQVEAVGGMGMLFPADRSDRAEAISKLREAESPGIDVERGHEALRSQLAFVDLQLGVFYRALQNSKDSPGNETENATQLGGEITALRLCISNALTTVEEATVISREERWTMLNDQFLEVRNQLRSWLDVALDSAPVTESDMPAALRSMYIGGDGTWKLTVEPTAHESGRSILHQSRLGRFVGAVRNAAPDALGPPVQIYESSNLIRTEYIRAALYAVAAILVILLFDFRSMADTLCAMAPVTVGFIGTFGIMGLAGMPLNFANIIILPLIFGVGVAAGVHAVHRWRDEPDGRPAGLSGGTGRGILLTMVTTMIGFGALLTAQHRGIRSLGFVMVIGLAVTLVACYTLLPALLRLRTNARRNDTCAAD